MLWGILPTDPRISFEYHLAGAILGVVLAFLLRDLDPRPPEKTYSWEGEEDDGDWPFGDPREGGPEGDAHRVGGGVTPAVLSHHRAYGSVPRRFTQDI
jgi:hypothetical protein